MKVAYYSHFIHRHVSRMVHITLKIQFDILLLMHFFKMHFTICNDYILMFKVLDGMYVDAYHLILRTGSLQEGIYITDKNRSWYISYVAYVSHGGGCSLRIKCVKPYGRYL